MDSYTSKILIKFLLSFERFQENDITIEQLQDEAYETAWLLDDSTSRSLKDEIDLLGEDIESLLYSRGTPPYKKDVQILYDHIYNIIKERFPLMAENVYKKYQDLWSNSANYFLWRKPEDKYDLDKYLIFTRNSNDIILIDDPNELYQVVFQLKLVGVEEIEDFPSV